MAPHNRAALIADRAVVPRHTSALQSLRGNGYDCAQITIPPDETDLIDRHKNLDLSSWLYDKLLAHHLERHCPVICLGGGVTTDLGGFVAATYLRGIPFVPCPTTLLAMVDASVGGKVGVNLPQGKNLVGCFYQPHLVVIDTDTLSTLSKRQLRFGLAECVKHGMIRDAELFNWTEDNLDAILALDSAALVELVYRNVQIKAQVVMEDEKESGPRAHLNFGHTFAHAIEATAGSETSSAGSQHGEAVALGMIAATRLAVGQGHCAAEVLKRLIHLLKRIGLPTTAANLAPIPRLMETMRLDKKVVDGHIHLVLPHRLGEVSIVKDTPDRIIEAAWESLRQPV